MNNEDETVMPDFNEWALNIFWGHDTNINTVESIEFALKQSFKQGMAYGNRTNKISDKGAS